MNISCGTGIGFIARNTSTYIGYWRWHTCIQTNSNYTRYYTRDDEECDMHTVHCYMQLTQNTNWMLMMTIWNIMLKTYTDHIDFYNEYMYYNKKSRFT